MYLPTNHPRNPDIILSGLKCQGFRRRSLHKTGAPRKMCLLLCSRWLASPMRQPPRLQMAQTLPARTPWGPACPARRGGSEREASWPGGQPTIGRVSEAQKAVCVADAGSRAATEREAKWEEAFCLWPFVNIKEAAASSSFLWRLVLSTF